MSYEIFFLKALLVTIIAELAAGITLKFLEKKLHLIKQKILQKINWGKFIMVIPMASIMTLPYVWFILPLIQFRPLFISIAELFAWLMESIFYRFCLNLNYKQALIFSFVLNLFSFLIGLLIF